ncbi:hypothetical protein K239x_24740 [Planctomycetes bacterium K23_9]|uniref:Uncharacterized protein n=1 Tax=Stieleria marina TaxID=1930275 RepID=A0A517NTR6_9BACT|nr:hypothetical protein K239x_24740 [Planctomycetes bacterium K23_9]
MALLGQRDRSVKQMRLLLQRYVCVMSLAASVVLLAVSSFAFSRVDSLSDQSAIRYTTPLVPPQFRDKITYPSEKFTTENTEYISIDGPGHYLRAHESLWLECLEHFLAETQITDDESPTWRDDRFPRHYDLPTQEFAIPYFDGWRAAQKQLQSALSHASEDDLRMKLRRDMRRARIGRVSVLGLLGLVALTIAWSFWPKKRLATEP